MKTLQKSSIISNFSLILPTHGDSLRSRSPWKWRLLRALWISTAFVLLSVSPHEMAWAKPGKGKQKGSPRKKPRKISKPKAPPVSWLTKDAEMAINRGHMALAIALYRGAVALRNEDPKLMYRLAEIYRMSGEFAEASQEFRRFIELSKDAAQKKKARAAIKMMADMPAPFVDKDLQKSVKARKHGMKAFRKGRKLSKKRKYSLAVRYFEASLMMDPSLVGVLRWLGQIYTKSKDKKKATTYYARYLRVMPAGKNADTVRKRLKKLKAKVLGTLNLKASYRCEVWINGSPVKGKKTPVKGFTLPKGEYTVIFYNRKYHIGRKKRVFVHKEKTSNLKFGFGILNVKLKPWARVRIEGLDVGLWPQVGIPARTKPYRAKFVSHDGKKTMDRLLTIRPKKKLVVKEWR